MLAIKKGKKPLSRAAETALTWIVAKAVADAPLPSSETWLELCNLRPPPDLDRLSVSSAAWTGLPLEQRIINLVRASTQCLGGRLEEAHVHFLPAVLALEQGDQKHAEEMLV